MILNNVFADTTDPTHEFGIYSIKPEVGFAAEFAFAELGYRFLIYANVVRRERKYMLRLEIPGLPPIAAFTGFVATFFGDIREHYTMTGEQFSYDHGAFLTNPSNCNETGVESDAVVATNTWEDPNSDLSLTSAAMPFPNLTGCDLLFFSPGIAVEPESTSAGEPSGYQVKLDVPQAADDFTGTGTPPTKEVRITFPLGTTVSPPSANGLAVCRETGPEGINIEGPESEVEGPDGLGQPVPGHCPLASEIGTVTATTPLLNEELKGHVFLAQPECGEEEQPACTPEYAEDGRLFRLDVELEAPERGVIIKLAGEATVSAGTGQITAIFKEAPEFPLGKLIVELKTGPRAPMDNPMSCGPATTEAQIMPWSFPVTPLVITANSFEVGWTAPGQPCPTTRPFAPSVVAKALSPEAGSTSPFDFQLNRQDREQSVLSLKSTLPAGLLANVSKVAECPEPQASEASLSACPASSQVGTTTVSVGSGSEPYYVTGKVFFTGQHDGAPFGLSIVVPAVAGPFNLGDIIVRIALYVDPHTTQVTAVSGPLPQKLDGIPLRIRTIDVLLDAQEFVRNPTGCAQQSATAEVDSDEGAVAHPSSPFAPSGCSNLAFKPQLSASTEAQSTKSGGTGVTFKIAYPTNAGQANIAKARITFPAKLSVRETTLRQACPAATFEANAAACPAASAIGNATVHTPLLDQPLMGPAYLVSYGSAKFPDVVFELQGENVTLVLQGETFVSSSGIVQVTFPAVPDAPFSTFETQLPAGPHSEFTSTQTATRARASQCGEKLIAPVAMVGQNGTQLSQNVKLQVTGCAAAAPSISLVKVRRSAHALFVTVKTSAKGGVRIAGTGLRTFVKTGTGAGKHTFEVALTRAGRRLATARRRIRLTVGLVIGKRKVYAHKRTVL